jgi:hypothetical protein
MLVRLMMKSLLQLCNEPHLSKNHCSTLMLLHCSMLHGELNWESTAKDPLPVLSYSSKKSLIKLSIYFTVSATSCIHKVLLNM